MRSSNSKLPLIILTLIAFALVVVIIVPLWEALFMASVLAAALYPLQRWLTARFAKRRYIAASVITIATLLLLVLPLAVVTVGVVKQIVDGANYVRTTLKDKGAAGIIDRLPPQIRRYAEQNTDVLESTKQKIVNYGGTAAVAAGRAVAATSRLVLQTVFMLIALLCLLADGNKLVAWLSRASPLPEEQTHELIHDFRGTSKAVLISILATAGAQAAAALVGYLIAGVAAKALFLTVVTFLFAMIPAIGASAVVLVVAAIQFALGHPVSAGFLCVWGLVVVGLVDNLLKPILIGNDMQFHEGVIFFALIGGLAVFGPVGLIAGPLIVSFFRTMVRFLNPSIEAVESADPSASSKAKA